MGSHTLSHSLRIVDTMSNEVDTQLDDAIREVTEAINTYGKPVWVAQVPKRVRDLVPNNIKAELLAQAQPSEGWRTAQDGKQDILSWCKNHVFDLVTVKELAEIGDISEATVRKIVQDRPDIFVKRESRQYEIRDPQADRKADK
jgi:hypothetical protein